MPLRAKSVFQLQHQLEALFGDERGKDMRMFSTEAIYTCHVVPNYLQGVDGKRQIVDLTKN